VAGQRFPLGALAYFRVVAKPSCTAWITSISVLVALPASWVQESCLSRFPVSHNPILSPHAFAQHINILTLKRVTDIKKK
jgi:hypothetical protein